MTKGYHIYVQYILKKIKPFAVTMYMIYITPFIAAVW